MAIREADFVKDGEPLSIDCIDCVDDFINQLPELIRIDYRGIADADDDMPRIVIDNGTWSLTLHTALNYAVAAMRDLKLEIDCLNERIKKDGL
jgi:hypothetical protein